MKNIGIISIALFFTGHAAERGFCSNNQGMLTQIISWAYVQYEHPKNFTDLVLVAKSWCNTVKNPLFMELCKKKGYMRPELVFYPIGLLFEGFIEEMNIEDIFKTKICSSEGLTIPECGSYQGSQPFYRDEKAAFRYKNLSFMSCSDKQKGIFYDEYTNDYIAVWVNPAYTMVYNREFADAFEYADDLDEKHKLFKQFYQSQMTLAHYMKQEQKVFDLEDLHGYKNDDKEHCPTVDPITAEPKDFVDIATLQSTYDYYYPVVLIDKTIAFDKFATKLPKEYVSTVSETEDAIDSMVDE